MIKIKDLRQEVSKEIKKLEQLSMKTYNLDNEILTGSIEAAIEDLENTLTLIEQLIREGAE